MKAQVTIIGLAVLLVVGVMLSRTPQRERPTTVADPVASRIPPRTTLATRTSVPRARSQLTSLEVLGNNASVTNLLGRLLAGKEPFVLTRQQVEPYLRENRRSAESLLAAYRATGDKILLNEALAKYPRDSRVNFAAAFESQSPEERRRRLDVFKQTAPDNALAGLLSAQAYFQAGQNDAAVQELTAAAAKAGLQTYTGDFMQNLEEAYRASGYSDLEAKAVAAYAMPLPYLAELRHLGQSLLDLAKLYQQSSDELAAQAALQMGLDLGRRLSESSDQKYLLQDMVGLAIERNVLETMNPDSPYDNAGQTVKDRLDELNRRRESLQGLQGEGVDSVLTRLSEMELIHYFDRLKVFGEVDALRWAANRQTKP